MCKAILFYHTHYHHSLLPNTSLNMFLCLCTDCLLSMANKEYAQFVSPHSFTAIAVRNGTAEYVRRQKL